MPAVAGRSGGGIGENVAPRTSREDPTGTGEEGQLLDNLRRRESRRSISTTQDDMGIPPAPSAQPTDEAKQMLDPTLNLG